MKKKQNQNQQNKPRFDNQPVSRYRVMRAAARLQTLPTGEQVIQRFSRWQRLEHQILLVSFTMLAVTGLPQRYAESPISALILQLFGGIDGARYIHHLFAIVMAIQSFYHVGSFIYNLVVYRFPGELWPTLSDITDAFKIMMYNLGLGKEPPRFGRFTFEEKVEYWALVWGTALMGITGIIQWFPAFFSRIPDYPIMRWMPDWVGVIFSGAAVPISRAAHSWEAVLAVLSILTWHMYHAVFKHKNTSIFTGYMSIEDMEHEHPAELEYILWAADLVEKARQRQAELRAVQEAAAQSYVAAREEVETEYSDEQEAVPVSEYE